MRDDRIYGNYGESPKDYSHNYVLLPFTVNNQLDQVHLHVHQTLMMMIGG